MAGEHLNGGGPIDRRPEGSNPPPIELEGGYDPDTVRELFEMQPDNRLTPAQMVRRSLFPRWEILSPAKFNPVDEENRRIDEILSQEHPDA
jgi:hypothetical protein